MSEAPVTGSNPASEPRPIRLRDALHKARIEAADRTGVVVDLRDAEVARLEILNDALDPLFAQVPALPLTVQEPPALQSLPPVGVLQVPAWKKPALCRRPGMPSS